MIVSETYLQWKDGSSSGRPDLRARAHLVEDGELVEVLYTTIEAISDVFFFKKKNNCWRIGSIINKIVDDRHQSQF